jgi:hypothetical protein
MRILHVDPYGTRKLLRNLPCETRLAALPRTDDGDGGKSRKVGFYCLFYRSFYISMHIESLALFLHGYKRDKVLRLAGYLSLEKTRLLIPQPALT